MTPIANAGFKACAIDVRATRLAEVSKVADYSMENIVGDVLGWPTPCRRTRGDPDRPRWGRRRLQSALIHPEKFVAVAAMSVVYTGVPERNFDDIMRRCSTTRTASLPVLLREVARPRRRMTPSARFPAALLLSIPAT